MGWDSCATLQAKNAWSGHYPLEGGVGGWVPRGRPWAGHCTRYFEATLLPRQVQVVVCEWRCGCVSCGWGVGGELGARCFESRKVRRSGVPPVPVRLAPGRGFVEWGSDGPPLVGVCAPPSYPRRRCGPVAGRSRCPDLLLAASAARRDNINVDGYVKTRKTE